MDTKPLSLAMVAGEASGDLLASLLLQGLQKKLPEGFTSHGIGDKKMIAQGFHADWTSDKLAVFGYLEALKHYREIVGIRNALRTRLLVAPPDVFVGVDAPDFNFGLEQSLRTAGIPTIHFVSPSIWAWRGERIHKIARAVDHMLLLFPFEEAIYREAGIAATYVGHPLAEVIPMQADRHTARRQLGLADDAEVLALMPGSRMGEIRHIAPVFIAAAMLLHAREPHIKIVVPLAGPATRLAFQALLEKGGAQHLPLSIVEGETHAALAACDAVLVASGTATLEAALFKCPMVIAYRMAYLNWLLMRNKGYLRWVGLPNILAREFLVPELIQDAMTPEALCDAVLFQLRDAANREKLHQRFGELHASLKRDTAALAAQVVIDVARS